VIYRSEIKGTAFLISPSLSNWREKRDRRTEKQASIPGLRITLPLGAIFYHAEIVILTLSGAKWKNPPGDPTSIAMILAYEPSSPWFFYLAIFPYQV